MAGQQTVITSYSIHYTKLYEVFLFRLLQNQALFSKKPQLRYNLVSRITSYNVCYTKLLRFGRGGTTALNWYDAADPRPDYYRNLPSYYEEDDFRYTYLENLWETDENYRQLNWDMFYDANRKNLYTVENESGITGNDVTGNRAMFMIEERRNDINRFDFSSLLSKELNENAKVVGGLTYMSNKTHNFKVVSDRNNFV